MKSCGELYGFVATRSGMHIFANLAVGFVRIGHKAGLHHQVIGLAEKGMIIHWKSKLENCKFKVKPAAKTNVSSGLFHFEFEDAFFLYKTFEFITHHYLAYTGRSTCEDHIADVERKIIGDIGNQAIEIV